MAISSTHTRRRQKRAPGLEVFGLEKPFGPPHATLQGEDAALLAYEAMKAKHRAGSREPTGPEEASPVPATHRSGGLNMNTTLSSEDEAPALEEEALSDGASSEGEDFDVQGLVGETCGFMQSFLSRNHRPDPDSPSVAKKGTQRAPLQRKPQPTVHVKMTKAQHARAEAVRKEKSAAEEKARRDQEKRDQAGRQVSRGGLARCRDSRAAVHRQRDQLFDALVGQQGLGEQRSGDPAPQLDQGLFPAIAGASQRHVPPLARVSARPKSRPPPP